MVCPVRAETFSGKGNISPGLFRGGHGKPHPTKHRFFLFEKQKTRLQREAGF